MDAIASIDAIHHAPTEHIYLQKWSWVSEDDRSVGHRTGFIGVRHVNKVCQLRFMYLVLEKIRFDRIRQDLP
jgi:hypothetical protein